jgi:phosphoribosylanthranilate isomerase
MPPPSIKICCIASREEAALAASHGATAVGLVSAMPSGPGVLDDAAIADVLGALPTGVASFLLTSRQTADALIAQHRALPASVLQLVDRVPREAFRRLRDALPGVTLVQVIHVIGEPSIGEAEEAARHADAILLDSGNPNAAVRELGGTGRRHDWTLSRRIRDAVPVPVWLAGGLHAGNVAEAVTTVRPHGVDVCSGVRTDGRLDPVKLAAFASAIDRGAG